MAIIDKAGACVALVGILLMAGGAYGVSPADKCEAAKNKIAGKYAFCRQKSEAKGITKGAAPDFTKCTGKFLEKWALAESDGTCPTFGDSGDVQGRVTAHSNFVALMLTGVRFVDNGDGTVTDTQTGLMWETKGNLDSTVTPTDPHDADNTYQWSADFPDQVIPNGDVFTDFLFALNKCTSSDGTTISGGFAGYCDWRLPTSAELVTLVDLSVTNCGTGAPCIFAAIGPTVPSFYWTSTGFISGPAFSRVVDFNDGSNNTLVARGQYRSVRAVREVP